MTYEEITLDDLTTKLLEEKINKKEILLSLPIRDRHGTRGAGGESNQVLK